MSPKTAPLDHPLRSRNDVPRSDVKKATRALAEALDALLAAHTAGTVGSDLDAPEKQAFIGELTRCLGGRVGISDLAVGDLVIQVVVADEAGAAAVAAAMTHTGLSAKASWFKGDETDSPWVVLVVPTR